jgi:hypothetical protein
MQWQGKTEHFKRCMYFFLSRLCIQIEQAFGLLVTKWCIFKKPLDMNFWQTTLVIDAAFHLHNFCIDEHELTVLHFHSCDPSTFTPNYEEFLDSLDGEDDTPK